MVSTFWPFLSLFPHTFPLPSLFLSLSPFGSSRLRESTHRSSPSGAILTDIATLLSCSLTYSSLHHREGNASLPFLICFPVSSLSSQNLLSEQASIAAMSTTSSKYQESLFSDPDEVSSGKEPDTWNHTLILLLRG